MRLYCHNCRRRVKLTHTSCPTCRSRLILWYVNVALFVITLLVLAGFFI